LMGRRSGYGAAGALASPKLLDRSAAPLAATGRVPASDW
jgi:hypothetical protein